ncbi:MAG TPA: mechanosensitive ion channel domain-containing protein [Bacteroidales bacterium]|nr:mechanosensitive ion channel domain-containing protein [Bacteroidales bacterium]
MLIRTDPAIWLKDLFIKTGLSYSLSSLFSTIALVMIVLLVSWLTNVIAKFIISRVVTRILHRTKSTWADIFLENKVFSRMSHFAPAFVIWFSAGWVLEAYPLWMVFVHKVAYVYMVLVATIIMNSFIESWHKIYNTLPIAQHRHIKGYVQLLKISVVVLAILIIISVIFRKDITSILAGLGAMAAVLILVFKDTLLGLVASIQLSVNKMLSVGDWITIPAKEVDGTVTDISLNTVKVQNFDKTIITIPTYSLVNEPFQNWRGMEESGVRRIRRAIFIDMRSIRFVDAEFKAKLSKYPLLNEYFENSDRNSLDSPSDTNANSPFFDHSAPTNLGLFRYYMESYLRFHPSIDPTQTLILRHRDPEGDGLPLQLIAFTKNNQLVPFENIQSEIFEHLLAIIDEFGLKVYQQATGDDLLSITGGK